MQHAWVRHVLYTNYRQEILKDTTIWKTQAQKRDNVSIKVDFLANTDYKPMLLSSADLPLPFVHSSDADTRSASIEIPCHLWNHNVHYLTHNSHTETHILSRLHILTSYFLQNALNLILPSKPGYPKQFFRFKGTD